MSTPLANPITASYLPLTEDAVLYWGVVKDLGFDPSVKGAVTAALSRSAILSMAARREEPSETVPDAISDDTTSIKALGPQTV